MTKGPLVTQPTAAPTRKVKYAAAVGGAFAIALPILETYWPGATECFEGGADFVQTAAPVVAAIVTGWFVRERDTPANPAT